MRRISRLKSIKFSVALGYISSTAEDSLILPLFSGQWVSTVYDISIMKNAFEKTDYAIDLLLYTNENSHKPSDDDLWLFFRTGHFTVGQHKSSEPLELTRCGDQEGKPTTAMRYLFRWLVIPP